VCQRRQRAGGTPRATLTLTGCERGWCCIAFAVSALPCKSQVCTLTGTFSNGVVEDRTWHFVAACHL